MNKQDFKKYEKDLPYSYVFGAFGTIELLTHKIKHCLAVIVSSSFTNTDAYKKINTLCAPCCINVIVDDNLIERLRDKGNIYVIGVFKKYESDLLNGNHILIESINDVGVIGTIIRSINGFEYNSLALINCDVDIYDEHLIRSSMGAFFNVNIKCFTTFNEYINKYKNNNIYQISTNGEKISVIDTTHPYSIIFNHQGNDLKCIEMIDNIPLENIVNIVLFSLYK